MVFLVSFAVLLINIGANQRIITKSQSLLKDNYPSVKYSFDMLRVLDELNSLLISPDMQVMDSTKLDSLNHFVNPYLEELKDNFELQEQNITEPGEKELTESLRANFMVFQKSIDRKEFRNNYEAYLTKFFNLRDDILRIHSLNVNLLESKNEEINASASRIQNIQEKVGIAGLTILAILILFLPMFLINPIDKLTKRMMNFYKTNFNKEIEIKANHELEKLEEIFEKIVLETKSGKNESGQE